MKDGEGTERKHGSNKTQSQIVPELALSDPIEQGQWANLPPKVLRDIIRRVEESEVSWPDRAAVVSCASVCNSWRKTTKDVVKTPQECGPISLKQENALRHALYPFVFNPAPNEKSFSIPLSKAEESDMDISSSGFSKSAVKVTSQESLMLKNKTPWCYWQQLILPTIYQSVNKRKSFYSLAELEETPSSWITATLFLPSAFASCFDPKPACE
ncbi:Tubby-like F-box protein 2 [Capsicum baccatum]|uniref:Tubby-like F-box protein 2 n=1 Tax=Capsicum baccatum TaxID=33114 RepID=A0A2G2XGV2_CAPBA|nr:Tubby-like F-box protein 2 [Capsicum baccatum]